MTQEQEHKLDKVAEQVGQMHTTLFGVEGQGGIHRRVERLEEHREEMKGIMAKVFGALIVIGSIASFLGAKLAHWFKIDTAP